VAADFSANPYFEVVSDALEINVEGFEIVIEDLTLSGAFAPDASYIDGVVMAGAIDTRPLVELVSPGGGDDAVCVLLQTFNADCEECGDGSGPYCLTVYVDSMQANDANMTIVPLTEDDIDSGC
jgi:hypothetical protein